MNILRQLTTPLSYLRIRHDVKPWFDWCIPAIMAAFACLLMAFLPKNVSFLGSNGLVFFVTDLVKMLIGFYIASLAAIATFPKEDMDEPMAGVPASLKVKRKGVVKDSKLSRRRFLCYLFGYLAFMGLVIYFIGAIAILLTDSLAVLPALKYGLYLKWCCIAFYIFLVANLLTTTLLGLHFMTDRIHR